jgi:protocatechuate 3,4-dioxygenase beta subunit
MPRKRCGFPRGAATLFVGAFAFLLLLPVTASAEGIEKAEKGTCSPTRADSEGPYYVAGAPLRESTGSGLVVRGRVLGYPGCEPLPGGRIEWWQANRSGRYDDDHRGSQNVDAGGNYRFTTDFPAAYRWRPPHIHFKAAAPGHRPLTTQLYLRGGETEVEFDIVLSPDR